MKSSSRGIGVRTRGNSLRCSVHGFVMGPPIRAGVRLGWVQVGSHKRRYRCPFTNRFKGSEPEALEITHVSSPDRHCIRPAPHRGGLCHESRRVRRRPMEQSEPGTGNVPGLVNLFVSAQVGTKLAGSGPSWGRQSVLEDDGEVV